jgi:alcohol dehydrogenase (cytochrome c)
MTRARVHPDLLRSTALVAFSAGTFCFALCLAPHLAAAQANQPPNQMTEGGLAKASGGAAPAQGISDAQVAVDDAMLMNAPTDDDNWLLYGRTYNNQRFSPLTQIDAQTVKTLAPVAIIQTGVADTFEDSPLEVNGVLYIITANDHVQAYNAVTGKILWSYTPTLQYSDLCCGPEARGVAVAYGKVYVAQLDARLVALNAATGAVEWKTDPATTLPAPTQYSFTMAPQVYHGMVIVGSAGAEYPTRGFVAAFDAQTGKVDWTFRTIASPGEPGGDTWSGDSWKTGGGSVWNTPAVDPANGLILFGVGNPNPDNWGESRKGANAYTDSVVAVHADTGKLAWWNQQVAHDLWDYDSAGPVVLFNAMDHGKEVPAAAEASKEGQVFIIDRLNGKLIRKSQPFVLQSANMWTVPSSKPVDIYPGANGGGMWSPSAYSPLTHYFYVMGDNEAWTYTANPPAASTPGNVPQVGMRLGGELKPVISEHPSDTIPPSGTLTAIDVDTGKIAWQYKSKLPMQGGVLATAGDLVFTGEMDGDFDAFDARTGARLWHYYLGVGVNAPPITYRVNGVQYVAVAAGGNGNNGNPELMKEIGRPQYGDTVAIFAVPRQVADATSH